MADDLTPDQVRARRFDAARKGYDRAQVDAFLTEVVGEMERLAAAVEASRGETLDLGLDDPEALAGELHRIGEEVHAILEAARSAAASMRTRASSDAEAWTTEAKDASARMLADATTQSQAMRASAWNEGTSLLAAATSEAKAIVAGAKEDALFVRAEAEREAIRLTGDAKRDREEIVRSARAEAEQIVESARTESEGVLSAAQQQADAAQERARALEDRRAELLAELEAARSAIGELEAEIDTRRQELEAPPPEPEPEPEPDERSHHGEDGGSVRIVSPSRFAPLRPVDAEELVAEVTALRSGRAEPPDVPTPEQTAPEPSAPVVVPIQRPPAEEAEPTDAWPDDEATIEDDSVTVIPVPPATPPEPMVATDAPQREEPAGDDTPTGEMPTVEIPTAEIAASDVAAEERAEPVDEPSPPPADVASVAAPQADEIGSLFARLRDGADATAAEPAGHEPIAEAAAPAVTRPDEVESAAAQSPTAEPEMARPASVDGGATDSAARAEIASTLPLQNATLRTIKRTLVDLQNETLEYLRTDSGWEPDEAFTDRFAEPFATLTAEIAGEPDDAAGRAFAADLFDALSSTIERTRSRGGGEREVASATSKVFRTWRSDEAERRVAAAAGDLAGV